MQSKRRTESVGNKPKKQRSAITLEEKLKIIRMYEDGKTITTLAGKMNRPVSTISTIVKAKVHILESTKDSLFTNTSTIITKKRCIIAEMEKLLFHWIDDMAQKQMPLSFLTIQEKAREIFKDLQMKAGITNNTFKASSGWFERFKRRSNLRSNKITGYAPIPIDATDEFREVLAEVIENGDYLPEQIFNVVETALFWKRLPPQTSIAKEEKSRSGFKAADDRITVMLGGNAKGDMKIKPLAVYHSQKPRAFKNIELSMLPVIWKSNTKARITRDIFKDWINDHFVPQVKEYCAEKGIPFKVLLLLDYTTSHSEELDGFHPCVEVAYLPLRTNLLLQPMDQGVIATFKAYYLWRTFSQAIKIIDTNQGVTLRDFWKNYNILNAIENVGLAWDEVTPETMNAAWKKLCPEMVTDVLTDEEQQIHQATDLCVNLAQRLQLEVDKEAFEILLLTHDDELSNGEDVIELEPFRKSEDNVKEEQTLTEKNFSIECLAEVFELIDMALSKLESMDSNTERFKNISDRINSEMSIYKTICDERTFHKSVKPSTSVEKHEPS